MNVVSFLIYTFLVTVTPGPTNIDILNTIKNKGFKGGVQYTYGAITAFTVLLIISTILNTFFAVIMPSLLFVMKVIGSVYMLYLIYTLFKKHSDKPEHSNIGTFKSGFNLQFLNPKVITFTMTIIPTFVLMGHPSIPIVVIYVMVISIIALFSFSIWIVFGTMLKSFLQNHELLVNVTMSLFLLYAAVMVWL
ncbi:LysE family translocator [Staphylococcus caeli]|uniref:Amino acid transporter LysE n=1 Tax=Staphylococcus caeli TaxID=2201815 RepID=A0A1D4HZJ7_9STAP|nr:LysE family translocator [Staphylococcus caeli]SCS42707.1 amino acid transporter LysE [Staphylococcus caeli]SCS61283.1 amino acid transporter LysE [Staphylococcus caeli]